MMVMSTIGAIFYLNRASIWCVLNSVKQLVYIAQVGI